MYVIMGNPHGISELKEITLDPIANYRNKVKVVLIDDENFAYAEILHNHGYLVTKKNDIDDIQSLEAYDIIFCDINGIGLKLNSKLQGAYVISEIRKKYPFKYIIAYSGRTQDLSLNHYFKMADQIIKKDADSSEWVEVLDNATQKVLSPHSQWLKMRKTFFQREVPLVDILRLEDRFVAAILKKNPEMFVSQKSIVHLSAETQQILKDFAFQVIKKLLLGII